MTEPLLANLAFTLVAMLALWRIAVRLGDVSFVDAVWGTGIAMLAALSWLELERPGERAGLIAAMTLIWGLRLGLYLFVRWRAQGEDGRYARILAEARQHGRFATGALTLVFAPQALLLFLTSLPAQVGVLASAAPAVPGALAGAGLALWLVGMMFETLGDAQLKAFRADPANADKVLDSGLWRYTRHPNYFGDCCVWWGIWLAALDTGTWAAWASAIGPLFVTFTLTRWSGKPLLERGMARRRPGYADYVARTSSFFPLPPRKG